MGLVCIKCCSYGKETIFQLTVERRLGIAQLVNIDVNIVNVLL